MPYLLEPVEFAGRGLPTGSFIGAATTLIHMDPALYPDPERFDPDRFADASRGPGVYFPFGGGGRRCLGAGFARPGGRLGMRGPFAAGSGRPPVDARGAQRGNGP
jgi:cytochrome P450